ncbi:hypothetical protein ACO0LF_14710 [Undibacterium sp. Di27W]|uniref:hypothetical protein n=1 Tax=Undibacterium sp. Di27W TaxID=3413036 RepID=UPI003BF1A6A9
MQGMIKLVKLVRMQPQERHCEIELSQAPQAQGATPVYLVNVREGQPDAEWQESSKTPFPVNLGQAKSLFAQVLASKLEQGFVDTSASTISIPSLQSGSGASDGSDGSDTASASHGDAMQWGHSSQTLVHKISKPTSLSEQEKILLDKLPPRAWSGLSRAERTRTVWRIGERRLPAAVPRLVELLGTADAMLDYCVAYAIGRCGDAGAKIAMQELSLRSQDAHVRHMALQAWLALAAPEEAQLYAHDLIAQWPADLQAAWQKAQLATSLQAGMDEVLLLLPAAKGWQGWRHDDWLEQLDIIARAGISTLARPLLLQQLNSLTVNVQVFRAFRHLYKTAEFCDDAELFGILHQRFEKAWPLFLLTSHTSYVYLERRYVSYADEVKKPNTRVAYSSLTRDYLRRRSWRILRRLGELGSPEFVNMATGILQACDDAHAGKPQIQRLVNWNYQSRSYTTELRYLSPYASWMVFNQLVHQHDSDVKTSRTALKWWIPATTDDLDYPLRTKRQEAFPKLWDAAPEKLFYLLQHSLCLGVHAFAARALSDNQLYCQQLDLQQLQSLLQSAYLPTREFAFHIIKQRFAGQTPGLDWLLILLTADYPPAAEFALGFIGKTPELYAQEAALIVAMITSPTSAVRAACRMLAYSSTVATRQQILHHLSDWARQTTMAAHQADAVREDLQWLILSLLAKQVALLPDQEIAEWCALLQAKQFWQQALATDILLAHPAGIAHVAPTLLRDLLQDADAGRQSLGSRLFAALPAEVLRQQPDLVATLATALDARVRAAMTPVISQLAPYADFSEKLLSHFIDVIFRSDNADGEASVHTDIINWCSGPLLAATLALPVEVQWRLLQARSKGAQELGAMLLNQEHGALAASLTVLQWANLGRHAVLQVRSQAQAYFRQHLSEVKQNLADALRILDTRWPETRNFAVDYFSKNIDTSEWALSQLLALCDHSQAPIQRLGRQLITRHFKVEDATEYVLSLSQHPSASMQLFVSQWLEQSVQTCGDLPSALQHLQQLRPYFLSVLSHVNKARTVKNRVIRFLQEQGLLSADHAQFVARIFTRQVLTVAIQDKAQYILGLTQLQASYPALADAADWPMQLIAPRMHKDAAMISAESV